MTCVVEHDDLGSQETADGVRHISRFRFAHKEIDVAFDPSGVPTSQWNERRMAQTLDRLAAEGLSSSFSDWNILP